ncbi:cyclic GMP-AMP synthase-like receptor 2 [Argopecten irradians]|uniref:cyclic GMP-AMP synthase-like receptor 2 n=1 Tax=Argopecten irradians TaxID=31199 RepID=UPI003718A707
MSDQGELYGDSWILHYILDMMMGNQEMVAIRRKLTLVLEQIDNAGNENSKTILTGSHTEGACMKGSDYDYMFIDNNVVVICRDQDTSTTPGKTVFIMRDAHSRPGYVNLELLKVGYRVSKHLSESIVPVGDLNVISSEMYRRSLADQYSDLLQITTDESGPANTVVNEKSRIGCDTDYVRAFICNSWPREADEWVNRPRLHEWPGKGLIDQIEHDGCCLVPVGDKTSPDPFLQWRISFVTAERKLIHSIGHVQFQVYCLIKYLKKQISTRLKQIYGDADILSSYVIKTVLFYALEFTPLSFWQEKNLFLCFMLCLNILISWVKAAYCPNYFINTNNMFLGKVRDENQQKLLHFIEDLHNMTWRCLSIGTFFKPSIGEYIRLVKHGAWELVLATPARLERESDLTIILGTMANTVTATHPKLFKHLSNLFCKSESDMDEYVAFYHMTTALSYKGMETFENQSPSRGNKDNYNCLRKSKKTMTPFASVCSSPGLLILASYHYQTGNYTKTLEMCGHVILSWRVFIDHFYEEDEDRYENLYCGRGYNLIYKCQQACVSSVMFSRTCRLMCPSQLHPELDTDDYIIIPPRPYAIFLSFICYHNLGDTRRRDAALTQLQTVKHDRSQGVSKWWIVHNILGICYEMIEDKERALREYTESMGAKVGLQWKNPAKARIQQLKQTY